MKIKNHILTIIVACFAVACHERQQVQDEPMYSIKSAQISQQALDGKVAFPTDREFGTFMLQNSLTEYTAPNAVWNFNSTQNCWLPTAYPGGIGISSPTTIYAYAPHNPSATQTNNKIDFELPYNQSTREEDYKNADVVWAKGEATIANTTLDLLFTHSMSKIIINLYGGLGFESGLPDGNNDPLNSNKFKVHLNGLKMNGKMDITSGTTSDLQPPTTENLYPRLTLNAEGKQGTGKSGDPKIYELIVAPQATTPNQILITVTIDGVSYTNTFTLDTREFEAAKEHHLNLTVNESSFDIGTQTISPWIPKSPDLGDLFRYSYMAEINLVTILKLTLSSVTQRTQYDITPPANASDGTRLGAISREYLYNSRLATRKIVAEAIVVYPMTPDKQGIDSVGGKVLQVIRKFAATDPALVTPLYPISLTIGNIHGGDIDNMVYKDGALTLPVIPIYVYYYHNTVLLSASGLPTPQKATVSTTPINVPIIPSLL